MNTSIAIKKLINIAPIIADLRPRLAKDEDFKGFIESYKNNENKGDNVDFVLRFLPCIYNNYEKELYEILGILSDKTAEEVANQSFAETVRVIKELLSDEDFKSFFIEA